MLLKLSSVHILTPPPQKKKSGTKNTKNKILFLNLALPSDFHTQLSLNRYLFDFQPPENNFAKCLSETNSTWS